MNKDGEGATDEQFLTVFKKMEQIFEEEYNVSSTLDFYDWLKGTNKEIQGLIEERSQSSCRVSANISIKKSNLLLSIKGDSLDPYRREYNKMIADFFKNNKK